MHTSRIVAFACLAGCPWLAGCETSDPTFAVLANKYVAPSDAAIADSTVVYKGWWAVAQFPSPVAPGEVSDAVRVVDGTDYGYALLAPGWDPSLGEAPSVLIPVRSAQRLHVERGETLNFIVSDATTVGNCAAGDPLSQEDADFITQRVFQSDFETVTYDAGSCRALPAAGSEAGTEPATEAGGSSATP